MEWEYAARGGNRSKDYKFSGSDRLDEVGWYEENMEGMTGPRPVGLKKSNKLGIYDMSGNVWEWCDDVYQHDYFQHGKRISSDWPFQGVQLHFRRISRGGSWGGTAFGCRVSYIDYDTDGYRDEYGGFRLALDKDSIHE